MAHQTMKAPDMETFKPEPMTSAARRAMTAAALNDPITARRVRQDMAALLRQGAKANGFADLADLTLAGYSDALAIEAGPDILVGLGLAPRASAARPVRTRKGAAA